MGGGFFPVGSTVRSLDCLTQRPVSHRLLLAQIIQLSTSGTRPRHLRTWATRPRACSMPLPGSDRYKPYLDGRTIEESRM